MSALAFASPAALGFNPLMAPITRVAEISIVGFDKRALKTQIAELSPTRQVRKMCARVAERICMQAEADAQPKIVGDFGFDPLGLGKDNMGFMREAEIKHGRLAMMAAIAWPLQELLHPLLAQVTGAPDLLVESNGASPSLVNGGLFQAEVLPALALFTLGCAYLEEKDLSNRKGLGCSWNEYPAPSGAFGRQPGNFGFDPMNFYRPLSTAERVAAQGRELMNGRAAMLAVATYVGVEAVTHTPIVLASPYFFEPVIFWPPFVEMMDSSFAMAGMNAS